MKDFFISYNKADRAWAEWIAWTLEEAGHTTVLQAWDFGVGSNFVLKMDEAAREAERTVAVLSPDYLASGFTAPEWAAAFAKDPRSTEQKLVPVRVRECDPGGLLGQIVWADLVGTTDEAAAKQTLLNAVQRGRGKPATKPAFPPAAGRAVTSHPRFPGALPPIWNVPHNRNPNFTGREALLKQLRAELTSGGRSALTAVHGLGGVGKTQTAVEYAFRYGGEYDLVWWIRSEQPATLASDYAALAPKLDISEVENQEAVIAALRDRLARTHRWLLIFDNANEPREVQPYLPPMTGAGHVLVTSRYSEWRALGKPLSVPSFERAEAVNFLQSRSGQADPDAADALADELGCLPLALVQAAAYIAAHGMPLPRYLELYREHKLELLRRGDPGDHAPVEVTWEISFAAVEQASPVAADLLRLLAFFAPDDIPLWGIFDNPAVLPAALAEGLASDLDCEDALAVLHRHSLIERIGDNASIHRLVQSVLRQRMTAEEIEMWSQAAVEVIWNAAPDEPREVRAWPVYESLLSHVLAATEHTRRLLASSEATGWLLNRFGQYLGNRAEYRQARNLLHDALSYFERVSGPDHPSVAICANNLGSVLHSQGDQAGARTYLERALQIIEADAGSDHPRLAKFLNNIGSVLREQGDLSGARVYYERAMRLDEEAFGPDHPNVAIRLSNLGVLLYALGDLQGARMHFERALRIEEAAYGLVHQDVSIDVNNLAAVLNALGDVEGARTHYERALRIDEAVFGPDHPNVALRLHNLGTVLKAQGNPEEARDRICRALLIFRRFLGEDHPWTRTAIHSLESIDQP